MDKYAKELNVNGMHIEMIFDFVPSEFTFSNLILHPDSNKLAEILMQRPIDMKGPSFKTRLSDDDIVYMQEQAKAHFDIVLETLKLMPRNMLFVVRY